MRVNNIYTSQINGASVSEIFYRSTHLDNKVSDLETRMKNVEENLAYKDFFETYFNDHYDPHLDSDSALSSDNNVCAMLERQADYLINSAESREMSRQDETAYVFVDEYMSKKIAREHLDVKEFSEDGSMSSVNIMDNDNVQIVKRPDKKNHILISREEIKPSDLVGDGEMKDILRDYQLLLDTIDEKTQKTSGQKRKLSLQKFLVKGDMIDVKHSYEGVLPRPKSTVEHNMFEHKYDYFDFSDFRTVRAFLTVNGDFYESHNLWLARIDFNNLLVKAGLTEEEALVAYCLEQGYTPKEIQEDYGIDSYRVRRTVMNNIAKKVVKLGDDYDCEDIDAYNFIESLKKYRDDNLNEITKREL